MKSAFLTASSLVVLLILSLVTARPARALPLTPITPAERDTRLLTVKHVPWNGEHWDGKVVNDFGCEVRTDTISVVDPITKAIRHLSIDIQAPPSSKSVPLVVIVPTIVGTNDWIEPVVARNLCENGFGSIIADVNDVSVPVDLPAWGGEDNNSRRAMWALQTVVDYAQTIPRFDKDRIAGLGLSLGGITTALFAGIEPRLKAAVVIVGGGNLPFILSQSDDSRVVNLRNKRMAVAGFKDVGQYENALRTSIMLDPFYFAPAVDNHKIMMVMAENDVKVPYVAQREQFAAFHNPNSLTFTGGHEDTIASMVYLYLGDVDDFLNARFKAVGPSALMLEPPPFHKTVDLDQLGR